MKTIGEFWVIREKGTMKFMPETRGRGGTHTEPCAGPQPRLFSSERAAKQALTWWRKGRVVVGQTFDDYGYSYEEGQRVIDVPGRRGRDMEAVPVTLSLVNE